MMPMRFGGVSGHARFGQHVLAGRERRTCDFTVHVGPGPDAERIDLRVIDRVPPVRIGFGDSVFPRHHCA